MRLGKLFDGAGIEYPEDISNIEITNIVTDSKKVTKGSAFICINGLHTDGHKYIKNAVDAGASVIVCEIGRDECEGGAATVKVKNTRRASALLYNAWHGDPAKDIKVIGVTGTNGKTSITYILKGLFEECGCRCGLIGTVGCLSGGRRLDYKSADTLANMTTPDPEALYGVIAEMAKDRVEYLFIEATSHASKLSKLDAVKFDTMVFTNLTQDHLDFHGDMEDYLFSKAKLFERCRYSVINIDDRYADDILKASRATKNILCSSCDKSRSDFFASHIALNGINGIRYDALYEDQRIAVSSSLYGSFSVMNTLEALAVAKIYGIPDDLIERALPKIKGAPGRMERVKVEENIDFSVFIDYAHTPDALEKILKNAREFREKGRIVLLFGCGGDRDPSKRKIMGSVASSLADFVVITSDNPRSEDREKIIRDIYKGIDKEKEHKIIPDRRSAIRYVIGNARKDDVIILAGKGHEKYEINEMGRVPFDEDKIVKEAVSEFFG